jgi:hypothetical protein
MSKKAGNNAAQRERKEKNVWCVCMIEKESGGGMGLGWKIKNE